MMVFMHGLKSIRFKQHPSGVRLPKGVRRRFHAIDDKTGITMFTCDLEKLFLRGGTRIHKDELNIAFLNSALESPPKMSTTWQLLNNGGLNLGSIIQRDTGQSGWLAYSAGGRDFELYEQTRLASKIARSSLGGSPDAYSVVENGIEIGIIQRLPRKRPHQKRRGLFRHITKLMTSYDWVLQLDADFTQDELMLLSAATLAVIEITIVNNRS